MTLAVLEPSFPANSVEQKLNDYGCLLGGVVRLT